MAHWLGLDAEFGLFVEPDVFHAPAVVDAVDHDGQAPDLGVPAIAAPAEVKQRLGVVVDEAALDLSDDALAFFLVRLPRLLLDHPVDLGVAIAVVVADPAAGVVLVKNRIGVVGERASEVERD
jgi:hypothetical protein